MDVCVCVCVFFFYDLIVAVDDFDVRVEEGRNRGREIRLVYAESGS